MSFDQFALEILLQIGKYVDREDLRELCLASPQLMSLFQDRAYSVAEFDETSESAKGLFALASGPRRQYVRKIRYAPHDPWPATEENHDPEIKLSDETRQALQSLNKFPSLEKFQFDLTGWDINEWEGVPFYFSHLTFHESFGPFDTEPWRILIEQSLQALIKSAGTFPQLELNGLPPTGEESYHAFQSDDWRSLLGNLESFEISLAIVEDEGSGPITAEHQEFIALFPDMFLNHLTHIQHLRITGSEAAVIGHVYNVEHCCNLLLPEEVKWPGWISFVEELDIEHIYPDIGPRFYHGELRPQHYQPVKYIIRRAI